MKAKGIFISTLAAINAYLGGFAYGFNAHPVLVIDPKLPPVVQNKSEPVNTSPAAVAKPGAASEKAKPAKGRHEVSKSNAVKAGNSGNSGKSGNSGNSGKSEKAPSKSGAKNGAAKSNAAKNNAAKNVGASSPERQKPH